MQQKTIDFNTATYVGIDAHPSEHTAVAVNRFEDEKGTLNFENNWNEINRFLSWLKNIDGISQNVIIGVEGRGGKGSGFIVSMLDTYEHVYEVNPQYTRQRRQFGTKGGKSVRITLRGLQLLISVYNMPVSHRLKRCQERYKGRCRIIRATGSLTARCIWLQLAKSTITQKGKNTTGKSWLKEKRKNMPYAVL